MLPHASKQRAGLLTPVLSEAGCMLLAPEGVYRCRSGSRLSVLVLRKCVPIADLLIYMRFAEMDPGNKHGTQAIPFRFTLPV